MVFWLTFKSSVSRDCLGCIALNAILRIRKVSTKPKLIPLRDSADSYEQRVYILREGTAPPPTVSNSVPFLNSRAPVGSIGNYCTLGYKPENYTVPVLWVRFLEAHSSNHIHCLSFHLKYKWFCHVLHIWKMSLFYLLPIKSRWWNTKGPFGLFFRSSY